MSINKHFEMPFSPVEKFLLLQYNLIDTIHLNLAASKYSKIGNFFSVDPGFVRFLVTSVCQKLFLVTLHARVNRNSIFLTHRCGTISWSRGQFFGSHFFSFHQNLIILINLESQSNFKFKLTSSKKFIFKFFLN